MSLPAITTATLERDACGDERVAGCRRRPRRAARRGEASKLVDVDLRAHRDVFVQPGDVRVSEPDAAVGGARADGGAIRRPMQQESVAEYQAIRSELTADLALFGVERWHEQRVVEDDVLVQHQGGELAPAGGNDADLVAFHEEAAAVPQPDGLSTRDRTHGEVILERHLREVPVGRAPHGVLFLAEHDAHAPGCLEKPGTAAEGEDRVECRGYRGGAEGIVASYGEQLALEQIHHDTESVRPLCPDATAGPSDTVLPRLEQLCDVRGDGHGDRVHRGVVGGV